MSIENITGLDLAAWERWVAYRKAIKKPLKDVSMHAAALKLAKYGNDQAEVVDNSISNQWQGLFDLKKSKPAPGEKPEKTDKQKAADAVAFEAANNRSAKGWESVERDPIGMLKLCEALLARYVVQLDQPDMAERIDWLSGRIADFLREADAKKVLGEPHLRAMVLQLYGERGIKRLQSRA